MCERPRCPPCLALDLLPQLNHREHKVFTHSRATVLEAADATAARTGSRSAAARSGCLVHTQRAVSTAAHTKQKQRTQLSTLRTPSATPRPITPQNSCRPSAKPATKPDALGRPCESTTSARLALARTASASRRRLPRKQKTATVCVCDCGQRGSGESGGQAGFVWCEDTQAAPGKGRRQERESTPPPGSQVSDVVAAEGA